MENMFGNLGGDGIGEIHAPEDMNPHENDDMRGDEDDRSVDSETADK
jgi:hypothetical protein